MSERRFPAPWSAELQPNYYVVRDANGQQLAYIYYSNDPDRRSPAKLLSKMSGAGHGMVTRVTDAPCNL